jgi:hypothetical protein
MSKRQERVTHWNNVHVEHPWEKYRRESNINFWALQFKINYLNNCKSMHTNMVVTVVWTEENIKVNLIEIIWVNDILNRKSLDHYGT